VLIDLLLSWLVDEIFIAAIDTYFGVSTCTKVSTSLALPA
jgi:hypothetical protein